LSTPIYISDLCGIFSHFGTKAVPVAEKRQMRV
jgi:hypothetical protein